MHHPDPLDLYGIWLARELGRHCLQAIQAESIDVEKLVGELVIQFLGIGEALREDR
jgi:hypothetical protein